MATGVVEMHLHDGPTYERWAERLGDHLDRVRAGMAAQRAEDGSAVG